LACHNIAQTVVPIGIKPQNLNFNFTYPNSTTMQLTKWVESGYLETNFPAVTQSTINYQDQSKPIGLRMRSFVDMNCAHCHRDGGYATVFALRFEFYKIVVCFFFIMFLIQILVQLGMKFQFHCNEQLPGSGHLPELRQLESSRARQRHAHVRVRAGAAIDLKLSHQINWFKMFIQHIGSIGLTNQPQMHTCHA
jgi:hypothetical protein